MGSLLIKNAQIVTMNAREDIVTGDVRIQDDLIHAIGPDLQPIPDETIIDATGRTVIPGFVQTHIHLCQTLFRGKADDLELLDWLKKSGFGRWKPLTIRNPSIIRPCSALAS